MNENLKQEINKLFTAKETAHAFKGSVFTFDTIPEKKLQNAIKHYAPIQNGEELVLLYDYSAKEGFVLTTSKLYVNQPTYDSASERDSAAVSSISSFTHRKGKGFTNPEEFIDIGCGSKTLTIQYMYGKPLMAALEKTVAILKSGGVVVEPDPNAPAAEAPQKESSDFEKGYKAADVAGKAKDAFGKISGLFGKK